MVSVAARRDPTDDDRDQAITIALNGLIHAEEVSAIAARLAPLHRRHDTFPGDSGASRESPILFEGLRERCLPDGNAHSRAEHHKSKFALRAAAMLHGGIDPGVLDEVQWWQSDDVWYWSLEARVAYVRAAADRTGRSVESICRRLAHDRGVALAGDLTP